MNEIELVQPKEVTTIKSQEWTQDQLALIKATVAKGATDDELKLFLHQCRRLQLDPIAKQVHFVKYGNSPGTVIIGIDGFRVVAHRSGQLDGIERGVKHDDKGNLVAGWARVHRKDWKFPAYTEVLLSEYTKPTGNWRTMAATMIQKVAEVAALRMAFPADLSGVYSHEEMEQAETTVQLVQPQSVVVQPSMPSYDQYARNTEAIAGQGGYVITLGKYKGKLMSEVPMHDLTSYVNYLRAQNAKDGKPFSRSMEEFLHNYEMLMQKPGLMREPGDDGDPGPEYRGEFGAGT